MYRSAVNISVAQPQTCSRLFRPWDGQDSTVSSSMTPSRKPLTPVDFIPSSPMNGNSLRINEWSSAESRTSSETTDLSENEEDIKITDEEKKEDKIKSVYSNALSTPMMPMQNMTGPQSTMLPVDHAQLYHFQQLQQQAFYYGLPAISPFFGLDPAGNTLLSGPSMALAGSNMSNMGSSSMAMGSGMDPMTMGAVGHEYARILAEEAQAKLMSSRKQRPKKFKCTYCDVAFSNNGQLKGHVRIHTGKSYKFIIYFT